VRELRDSARYLDLNAHLWYGRTVTLTHDLNRQQINSLFEEKYRIHQTDIAKKLNTGFASVNAFNAGLSHVRPHTNVATSEVIKNIIFEVVPHPSYSPRFSLLQLSRNISKELISSCYGKMVQRAA
jgi:hypothetical protein